MTLRQPERPRIPGVADDAAPGRPLVIARHQLPVNAHAGTFRKIGLTLFYGPYSASPRQPVQIDTISNPVVVDEDFMLGLDSQGYPYPCVLPEFVQSYQHAGDVDSLGPMR